MIGFDADFPMDDEHVTRGTIGIDAGLGTGTLEAALKSDSTPVSRKGAAAELRLQGDRLRGKYAAVGIDVRVGYHFLVDGAAPPIDPSINTHSQGVQVFGGIAFKLRFSLLH